MSLLITRKDIIFSFLNESRKKGKGGKTSTPPPPGEAKETETPPTGPPPGAAPSAPGTPPPSTPPGTSIPNPPRTKRPPSEGIAHDTLHDKLKEAFPNAKVWGKIHPQRQSEIVAAFGKTQAITGLRNAADEQHFANLKAYTADQAARAEEALQKKKEVFASNRAMYDEQDVKRRERDQAQRDKLAGEREVIDQFKGQIYGIEQEVLPKAAEIEGRKETEEKQQRELGSWDSKNKREITTNKNLENEKKSLEQDRLDILGNFVNNGARKLASTGTTLLGAAQRIASGARR